VDYGTDGTPVSAVPATGYHFVDWSPDGSTDNPRTDTNVTADISVTANFAADDTTAPSVTLSGGGSGTTTTAAFVITAQFSEPVLNFVSGDVTVSNASVSGFTAVDGDTYTFTVTATTSGPVTVQVLANKANDAALNPNTASNILSWTYFNAADYSVAYQSPLDQSTSSSVVINKGKLGRVIPVKVIVYKNGVAQTSSQIAEGSLTFAANTVSCSGGSASDTIEVYADAGQSSAGTNWFRWTSPHWIYNFDTNQTTPALVLNKCYRLDVYLYGVKISNTPYAIFQPVK
jgi:hypothetical protein